MPDILIVGGGVMGLLAAYELRGRGLGVTILERDQPGRQASWASAGILSKTVNWQGGDPYTDLRGASVSLYPTLVAALQDETDLNVQYTMNGIIIPALSPDEADALRAETRLL